MSKPCRAAAKGSKAIDKAPRQVIRPQQGPQERFLASSADIAIYGGAAGGGKSWGLLFEPLRHAGNPEFAAVFFRRNTTQVRNVGGLWDESLKLYPLTGAKPVSHLLEWRWAKGGKIKFAHLEHEDTVLDWQGSQIPLICFDELTHFSETQFFYMLSRNRSMCGIRPYVRATCNPDADSWVAKFIEWWIDQETGLPIPERSGVLRWFIRLSETLIWADTREELIEQYGSPSLPDDHEDQVRPKSVTFIAAKLSDNKELLKADPNYKANLMALSRVERERLLGGNWKVRPSAGMYFRRSDATIIESIPDDVTKWVRRWDFAATEPGESSPDPDWTVGVLMGIRKNGRYVVAHAERCRERSHKVRELVQKTAKSDQEFLSTIYHKPIRVKIGLAQDPGQAGKEQVESYVKELAGYSVEICKESGDKVVRADPFAAQWQAGNVDVVRGAWNEPYFAILEAFPTKGVHDDDVDASSGAFSMLTGNSINTWAKLGKR